MLMLINLTLFETHFFDSSRVIAETKIQVCDVFSL